MLGLADEVWWSRLGQPDMHTWEEAKQELRLLEKQLSKDDHDPKALACYGVLLRGSVTAPDVSETIPPNPVERSSYDECCRALSVLGTREGRREIYRKITERAGCGGGTIGS